jgi:hypothetical protein
MQDLISIETGSFGRGRAPKRNTIWLNGRIYANPNARAAWGLLTLN